MGEINIAELQNLTVLEIADRIGELDAAQLVELRRLETEDGKADGRKGVIAAIDEAEAALAEAGPNNNQNDNAGGPPASAADANEPPAWMAPDYNGPLDIEQAQWRQHNIKPVGGVVTK